MDDGGAIVWSDARVLYGRSYDAELDILASKLF